MLVAYFFVGDMFAYLFMYQACDNGRGAILLSVARGKVSEGIDFGEEITTLSTTGVTTCNISLSEHYITYM